MSTSRPPLSLPNRYFSQKAFTLIELLVVISIIALLISILLPALASARQVAKQATCMNQVRQISLGMNFYANEHEEYVVSGRYYSATTATRDDNAWFTRLTPYMSSASSIGSVLSTPAAEVKAFNHIWQDMTCPAIPISDSSPYVLQGVPLTYGMHAATGHWGGSRLYKNGYGLINYYDPANPSDHGALRRIHEITRPSDCLAFADSFNSDYVFAHMTKYEGAVGAGGISNDFTEDHPGGFSTVFMDGHGKMVEEDRIRDDADPMWVAVAQ